MKIRKQENKKPLIGIRAPTLLHQLLDDVKTDNGSKSINEEGLNALWAHVQYKIEEPMNAAMTLEEIEKKRSALLELITRSAQSLKKLDEHHSRLIERKTRRDAAQMIQDAANN